MKTESHFMKPSILALLIGTSAVVLTGCVNPDGTQNNTGSGALIGGAMGALTGAAIGGRHNGGPDALFGAAAGALAGGLVGNSMDREQEARFKAQPSQTYTTVTQNQPVSLADVKALAKAGVSEDVIISQIQNSRTVYHLIAADIVDLRDSGVTDKVVNYMINTPAIVGNATPAPASTVVVQQAPPPPPTETVVVSPGPDYVWIGGEYQWNGFAWVWFGGHWGYPPHMHAVWISGRDWHDRYGWHHDRGHWG
jgi:uncharacterized protein YcfJ